MNACDVGNGMKRAGGGRWVNRSSKWLTPEKRAAIYLRDDFRCVYCDREAHGRAQPSAIYPGLQVDHVVPRSQGGSNGADNLVTSCDTCNRRKADRTLGEWLAQSNAYETRNLRGVRGRVGRALRTPIDLRAGKHHVGARASRPLPEYATKTSRARRALRSNEPDAFANAVPF